MGGVKCKSQSTLLMTSTDCIPAPTSITPYHIQVPTRKQHITTPVSSTTGINNAASQRQTDAAVSAASEGVSPTAAAECRSFLPLMLAELSPAKTFLA